MQLKLFTTSLLPILQYNIKKKEEIVEQAPPEPDNPLMRKKKTPEELAAEAEAEDLDDFTSEYFYFLQLSSLSNFWYILPLSINFHTLTLTESSKLI